MGISLKLHGSLSICIDELDDAELKLLKNWIYYRKKDGRFIWDVKYTDRFDLGLKQYDGGLEILLEQLREFFIECAKFSATPFSDVVAFTIKSDRDVECGCIYIDPDNKQIKTTGYSQNGQLLSNILKW